MQGAVPGDERATALARVLSDLRGCRRCALMHPPPISDVRASHQALIYGQAPGVREPDLGRPFAHTAGRRLFEWFRAIGIVDEAMFRETFAMSAVCKCYPGRVAGARGDRVPTREEIANCRPWTDLLVSLLDPPLVIPVGGLAIRAWLGRGAKLDDIIGHRLELDGRAVVPLPHPSGVSVWLNDPGRRRLVDVAVAHVGEILSL